ncbi:MAG TPA: diacylglycerol kinase family protein [Gaiella sp.]|nr:diacylglycerol kinase family protein [Gaiella sp.]
MGALLIVNPRASNVSATLVERIVAELPPDLQVVETGGPGEATELAREREDAVDAIYSLGGDGTYNEVLNGVAGRVPLGFLPGGGTSVLPRALGVGRDPVTAARVVARGSTRRIGLGRVNGRRFAFNAGVGFDAELVRRIDELGRGDDGRRPGDAAFVRAAVGMIAGRRGRFPPALAIEGAGRAAFALVANCDPYTYAGRIPVRASRGASFDRGLDIVAPVSVGPAGVLRLLFELRRGTTGRRGLTVLHDAERVVVRCDAPMPLQVDGEDLGDVETAVFEAERDAVDVFVPGPDA